MDKLKACQGVMIMERMKELDKLMARLGYTPQLRRGILIEIVSVLKMQQAEIERLKPLAELGELAVELLDTEYCVVHVMRTAFMNGLNSNCEGCAALKICRKRAELRGEYSGNR